MLRKIFRSGFGLVGLCLSLSSYGQTNPAEKFIIQCLGQTSIPTSNYSCIASDPEGNGSITWRIIQAHSIEILASGRFSNLAVAPEKVQKVQHLPPNSTELGFIDDSIRFVAYSKNYTMTIRFECGNSRTAMVSLGRNATDLPDEKYVGCHRE